MVACKTIYRDIFMKKTKELINLIIVSLWCLILHALSQMVIYAIRSIQENNARCTTGVKGNYLLLLTCPLNVHNMSLTWPLNGSNVSNTHP